jgi:hypothetical protein
MTTSAYDIVVKLDQLTDARAVPRSAGDEQALGDDQILCRVDLYAFTANNVTYGVAGDSIGYWRFYPSPEPGFGRIPVWGFATVIASRHPLVPVGERLYGYWPMSTDVVLSAGDVTTSGLVDKAEHRAALPAVYNRYARLSGDRSFTPGSEPYQALLRPLFLTSYLIDDFLDENGFFGARTVFVASASSKTAIGLASMLSERRATGIRTVGLTSKANAPFVGQLGFYDRVVPYEDVASLSAPEGAVLVDMSGSRRVLRDVHGTLGPDLKYSCRVGLAHWQEAAPAQGLDLPGPKALFFFAPDRIAKRISDWGPAGFMQRTATALSAFVAASPRWLEVSSVDGPDAILSAYRKMAAGEIKPQTGMIFTP